MNEWIEGSDAKSTVVSVWTPWGEQTVLRGATRQAARRAADVWKRRDDASSAWSSERATAN